jgi:threonine synthase
MPSGAGRSSESILKRYRDFLPLAGEHEHLWLGEGFTPLVQAPQAAAGLRGARLLLKNETVNPTWSFKDRGTVVAVADALERKACCLGVVSTGNMAASVSAYGSRAGLPVLVLVGEGIPDVKLGPIAVYGSSIVRVAGDYPALYEASLALARSGIRFLNSDAPARVEGSKTIAFELCEQLAPVVPDWVIVPTSSGGNLRGIIKGFEEMASAGRIDRLPRFVCAQAAGCAPIADAWNRGSSRIIPVEHPRTIAHAIENPRPPSGNAVLRKLDTVRGCCVAVDDRSILEAQRAMAASGIFAQPSGAVPLAAAEALAQRGLLAAGATAVCVVTGSGLKHPSEQPPRPTVRDCTREKLGDIVHEWLATASQGRVS